MDMTQTETIKTDSQIGQALIALLHRGGVAAYYWTLPDKLSYWHPVGNNGVVPVARDVYFPVHPTKAIKRNDQRATKKDRDVCVINGVFTEVDAKDRRYLNPGEQAEYDRIEADHKAALGVYKLNYKAWVEAGRVGDEPTIPPKEKLVFDMDAAKAKALERVRSMPLAPSVIIDSGGGYHLYWILEHTFIITTDADRTRITRLQARWVDVMGGDTGAKDLERVLRVPGTTNGKYNPPRPVTVVDASFTRYPLSQIEALAPVLPDEAVTPIAKAKARAEAAHVEGGWTVKQIGRIARLFGEANSIVDILKQNAYIVVGNTVWRPGKTTDETLSGNIKNGCYWSFSSSDMDLGAMEGGNPAYSAFAAWAVFDHGGDQQAAASAVNVSRGLGMTPKVVWPTMEPLPPGVEHDLDGIPAPDDPPPDSAPAPGTLPKRLPSIQTNDREPRDVRKDCIEALAKTNEIFVRGGAPVRVLTDEKGRVSIENITVDTLCAMLTTKANFFVVRTSEKGKAIKTVAALPVRVATDILSIGHWPEFPALEAVIESPTMRPDGSILSVAGYDKETKLFYKPPPDFKFPDIPEAPDQDDVAAALVLLREVVCDFPFEDEASADNALAAILTPIVRPMISKNVPLVMADAPQQSTGKTLFAQVIGGLATGEMPEASPAPGSHEEWRKCITAHLSGGRAVIVLDNITETIEDGALAAVLTSTSWSDRLLGRNDKVIRLPALACWIATGNNLTVGGDLATRCYLIRLDAKMSRPEERDSKQFTHPDLENWIKINRGMLLGAALTLARAWHLAGRPAPDCPRFRLEEWRNVVGGILCFAGVKNFLGNIRQFRDAADSDGPVWEAFIGQLAKVFGSQAVTPGQIYGRLVASEEMASYLPDGLLSELGDPENPKHKNKFAQTLAFSFRARAGKHHGDTQARVVKAKSTTGGQFWSFYVK